VEFESANPTVIKSIKQRDLLNTWLRLYAREQLTPRIEDYKPERLADELPDLVYYTVDTAQQPPRLLIQSDGTRCRAPTATPARAAISTTISDPGWSRS
jgi:hypothetical protein